MPYGNPAGYLKPNQAQDWNAVLQRMNQSGATMADPSGQMMYPGGAPGGKMPQSPASQRQGMTIQNGGQAPAQMNFEEFAGPGQGWIATSAQPMANWNIPVEPSTLAKQGFANSDPGSFLKLMQEADRDKAAISAASADRAIRQGVLDNDRRKTDLDFQKFRDDPTGVKNLKEKVALTNYSDRQGKGVDQETNRKLYDEELAGFNKLGQQAPVQGQAQQAPVGDINSLISNIREPNSLATDLLQAQERFRSPEALTELAKQLRMTNRLGSVEDLQQKLAEAAMSRYATTGIGVGGPAGFGVDMGFFGRNLRTPGGKTYNTSGALGTPFADVGSGLQKIFTGRESLNRQGAEAQKLLEIMRAIESAGGTGGR